MGREPSASTAGSRADTKSTGVDSRADSGAGAAAGLERFDDSHGLEPESHGARVSPGLEPLGLAGSEPGRLIAEAESAVAGAGSGVDSGPAASGSWSALTPGLVTVTCGVVIPQWGVPANEQIEVASALGECLEQLFPGGIEGKYACWVRLVFACGAISVSAVNRHGGKLPPLFMKQARAPASSAPIAASIDTAPLDLASAA